MKKKIKKITSPYLKEIIAENIPYEFTLVLQHGKEIAYFYLEKDANEYIEFLTIKTNKYDTNQYTRMG
jgi:hypothetical protein